MHTHDEWAGRDRQSAVDVNAYLKDMDSFTWQFIGRIGLIVGASAEHIDWVAFKAMVDELHAQLEHAEGCYRGRLKWLEMVTEKVECATPSLALSETGEAA